MSADEWLKKNDGYEYITKSGQKLEDAKKYMRVLLTDRDALVRYVRVGKEIADGEEHYTGRSSQNDYDALLEELCLQLNEAYEAFSQELKDKIEHERPPTSSP